MQIQASVAETEIDLEVGPDVDLGELLARLEHDRDLLRDVLDIFTEEFPALCGRLTSALGRGEMREVRVAAHTLKGMLASLSFGKAAGAAMRMEQMAAEFRVEGMAAEMRRMEQYAELGREQLAAVCREVVSMRILLADDDAVSRKILQRTLERSGFEVMCVEDGLQAAEALLSPDPPRVAILDWVMPGKDGPSVCREVRAAVDAPYVYLILLTAKEASGDIVLGLEAGADDYLVKPCNAYELKARIRAGERILDLQDKLIFEAQHDSLTGLPNRGYFVKRLSDAVRRTQEEKGYEFTLLFVDVDRFKVINDSLGHLTGDGLMKGIAQRLVKAVRAEDTVSRERRLRRKGRVSTDVVSRIGGDEFVLLLDNFANVEDGIRVAERVQRTLDPPFVVDGHEIFVTASIGISNSGGDTTDPEEILRGADTAMYRAKRLGRARYEVSDGTGNAAAARGFRLERDLRAAIAREEFEVHYQPIIHLRDGAIVSFEALVRWRHPELGLVQPGMFIPIAEESGLIVPMGELVMREACRQTQAWNADAARPVGICVNISPKQFGRKDLVAQVREMLRETSLAADCLELEVTENLTMQDAVRTAQIMHELSKAGVGLSLDDFGTGYSSLSYLKRFPIRTLKIDRSFVADMERSPESCEIVQTVIALGHRLGLKVVAEGIETEDQRRLLTELGCDLGQGFLFSRPVPAERATAMLAESRGAMQLMTVERKRNAA